MRFWMIAAAAFVAMAGSHAKRLEEVFTQFHWDKDGNALEPFDFHLEDRGKIQIVDFKMNGDAFAVYDNGQLLGETPRIAPLAKSNAFAATPEEAQGDARFSQAIYELDQGSHVITIVSLGAFESGTAAIRLMPRLQDAYDMSFSNIDEEKKGSTEHQEKENQEEEGEAAKTIEIKEDSQEDEHSQASSEEDDNPDTITRTKTRWVLQMPLATPTSSQDASSVPVPISSSISGSQQRQAISSLSSHENGHSHSVPVSSSKAEPSESAPSPSAASLSSAESSSLH